MNKDDLSPTMELALATAREAGGSLHRHPGGYWAGPNWKRGDYKHDWFGTQTIRALVKRGHMTFVDWKQATLT